eukprot:g14721.t1
MVYTVKNLKLKEPEYTWIGCIAFCYVLASILNLTVLVAIESSSKWSAHEPIRNGDKVPDWYDPCQAQEAPCMRSEREAQSLQISYVMEYDQISYENDNVPVAITQQLYYFLGIQPDDVEVTSELVRKVRITNNVVREIGKLKISIRFFKPYIWGRLSPQMALNAFIKNIRSTGSPFFLPYFADGDQALPVVGDKAFDVSDVAEDGYETMSNSNGNPYKDGKEFSVIVGPDDQRPPSRNHADHAAYIIYWSMGIQFLLAYLMSRWGWENQCEHLGDIRLTSKKGDGNNFRQEWPVYIHLLLTIFRLEILPEAIEVLKCKQEFYGFSLLITTNVIFQAVPCLILQLYLGFASGLGFGQLFLLSAIFCNLCNVAAFGFLWERNQAWVMKRITIDLSTAVNFSVQTRVVPLLGLFRVVEILARVLPIVVTMIVYGEQVVFYILAADAVIMFVLMFYTMALQGYHLGGDPYRCTCTSIFSFLSRYIFGVCFLTFFYFDSLLGRTRHNGFVAPSLYYFARLGEVAIMAYSWGLFEVGLPLSPPEPHGSSDSLERTAAGVRIAGGKNGTILPGNSLFSSEVHEYQTNAVGDLIVASFLFNILLLVLLVKSFKTMQKYYATPKHERHGLCPCVCYTTDVKKFLVRPSTKTDDTTSTHYIKREEKAEKEETEEEREARIEKEAREALSSGADAALNAALAELSESEESSSSNFGNDDDNDFFESDDNTDDESLEFSETKGD